MTVKLQHIFINCLHIYLFGYSKCCHPYCDSDIQAIYANEQQHLMFS